jgi:NADH-quinone oxidoreductase subunit G
LLYEHFGSEELTRLAQPIRARTPQSYAVMHALDARRRGVVEGGNVNVTIAGIVLQLPARVRDDFPQGFVGLPVGLAGIPPLVAGAPCDVESGA